MCSPPVTKYSFMGLFHFNFFYMMVKKMCFYDDLAANFFFFSFSLGELARGGGLMEGLSEEVTFKSWGRSQTR